MLWPGLIVFSLSFKVFSVRSNKKEKLLRARTTRTNFGLMFFLARRVSGMAHNIMAHVSAANRSAFFSTIGINIKNGAKLILKAKIIRPLVAFLASLGLIF